MRIEEIYISAFGGISDLTLSFEKGFQVIYGENENGKSTVMAFLKMMFYGSGKKGSNPTKNPRAKYTPWNSDAAMGGRVIFEQNGKRFRLEREFRKSDSTDRITLTDLDFGTSLPAESNIGVRIFGIGAAAFERSLFIDGFGGFSPDEDAVGELNSRLSNLVLTGDEDTSYQTVLSRLESARYKVISKSGRAGTYVKDSMQLEELVSRRAAADTKYRERERLLARLDELKNNFSELKTQYDSAKAIADSEADIRSAEKLREYLKEKQSLDELNAVLRLDDGGIADDAFVKKVDFCFKKYDAEALKVSDAERETERLKTELALSSEERIDKTKAELSDINNRMAALRDEKEAAESETLEIQAALESAQSQKERAAAAKKAFNPVLLIIGAVLVTAGAVLFFTAGPIAAAVAGVAGIVAAVLGFVFRPKDKNRLYEAERRINSLLSERAEARNKIASIQEQLNVLSANLGLIISALNTDSAIRRKRLTDLEERNAVLKQAKECCQSALDELVGIFGKYSDKKVPEEIRSELETLRTKADEQKSIKLKLNYLSRDLGGISYEEAEKKLETISGKKMSDNIDFEQIKRDVEEKSDALNAIRSEASDINGQLKANSKGNDDPSELLREIEQLKETMNVKKSFCDASVIAEEVLAESFAEARRGYGTVLEKRTREIFSRITDGRYNAVHTSDTLELSVEQNGVFGTREIGFLSSGTADQAYLSLRLALSELIAENGSLPVLLDDAFAQYDDRRTAEAMTFLKEYAGDSQAVLFTCHNSVCEFAQQNGIPVKNLGKP